MLAHQHLVDQLPRWLGWNTYAQYHGRDWPIRVGNKSGELDGIRADVGLVEARGRVRDLLRKQLGESAGEVSRRLSLDDVVSGEAGRAGAVT